MVVITEIFAIIKGVCIGPSDKFPQFPSLSYLKLGHIARRRPLENGGNNMNVLVINAGSSSLKYQLLDPDTKDVLAKGLCERIGIDGHIKHTPTGGDVYDADRYMPDHEAAIKLVMEVLTHNYYGVIKDMSEIDAVGHRVVHGGEEFTHSVIIDSAVMKGIRECIPLAPLHNPANITGINACRAVMEKHNDEVRNEQEKWGFMATPYTAAALAVPALFHTFYYAFSGGRNPEVMKTEHKVMRILEQAYADKTNCFPKTRYRALTWGGPPCYWLQFPNWLYNCWGILVIAGMDLFSGNVLIDTTDEETILDGIARNYETGVMRRHLTGGWRHLVEFWDEAEKFHCDMVILHDDITCKGALGLTGVILDQAKEKKTKLMVVSNDMFDHRTISRADIRQQVNDFMFSVMQAEPLDASLLQYDDYEGW